MTEWQPIETAPKEGQILLFNHNGISIDCWGAYCRYNYPKFTHWMPLPEAPK